ncbi:MAG: hypothetical protein C0624_05600 [Desulfuromonas sp.]|nr:MAG: hypothetical protein C0624_05600 [Desulfuromonas sp.]
MKKTDVPQDVGIAEGQSEVAYAVGENGEYELVSSKGWEPKNVANYQAWDIIADQIETVRNQVRSGKLSPLAYQMTKHQMDSRLMASYIGIAHWRAKRHLKPKVFAKLDRELLEKYATLFRVSVEQLCDPETVNEDYQPGRDRLL